MEEGSIDGNQAIPANNQAPEITQPRKGPLDFPSPAIPPQFPAVLKLRLNPVAPMRTNQVNVMRFQPPTQRITVICLVSDKPFEPLTDPARTPPWHFHLRQRFLDQLHFRRRGRRQGASQRNTLAIDHHHPLRTFTPLGFPDAQPPFFAGAKLPSAKVSSQSRYPRSSNCLKKARQISTQTPKSSQDFKRRQQVEGLGYRSGRSRQRAPLFSTQRMPSMTWRLLAQGRPPFLPFLFLGSNGSILFHCSSCKYWGVRAIGSPPIAFYPNSLKKSRLISEIAKVQML